MKTLFLIRHSITTGNERRWYYGSIDLPLSEAGRALCRSLKGSFALPEGTSFATSGMLRAEETLQLLFGDVAHEQFPGLSEMCMGRFEKHTYEELRDDEDFQRWCEDDSFVIPGGESNLDYAQRVESSLRDVIATHSGSLFIVCHGGTIRRAMCFLFPDSGKSFWDWKTDACHGYAVHFEDNTSLSYESI